MFNFCNITQKTEFVESKQSDSKPCLPGSYPTLPQLEGSVY